VREAAAALLLIFTFGGLLLVLEKVFASMSRGRGGDCEPFSLTGVPPSGIRPRFVRLRYPSGNSTRIRGDFAHLDTISHAGDMIPCKSDCAIWYPHSEGRQVAR
jgi:hypothetical protein